MNIMNVHNFASSHEFFGNFSLQISWS